MMSVDVASKAAAYETQARERMTDIGAGSSAFGPIFRAAVITQQAVSYFECYMSW